MLQASSGIREIVAGIELQGVETGTALLPARSIFAHPLERVGRRNEHPRLGFLSGAARLGTG